MNEYCSENRPWCNMAQPGGGVGRTPWTRRSRGEPDEGGFWVLPAREDSKCKDSRLERVGGTKGY